MDREFLREDYVGLPSSEAHHLPLTEGVTPRRKATKASALSCRGADDCQWLARGRYRFPRPNIRPNRPAIELAGLISTRVDPSGSGRFAACSVESVVETYVV